MKRVSSFSLYHGIIKETKDFGRYFTQPSALGIYTYLNFDKVNILQNYLIAICINRIGYLKVICISICIGIITIS